MPRITDPFTPLFHELLEPLIRLDLSGVQFRILFWVARNSYGRGGEFYARYSWRKIAADLGADRRGIARLGARLLKDGILRYGEEGEIGIDKPRIRSLGLGLQSQGDYGPMGQTVSKVGTTVPGSILIIKKEERESDSVDLVSKDVKEALPPNSAPPPFQNFGPDGLLALWNERAGKLGLPLARKLTPARQKHAVARLKEEPDRTTWEQALDRIASSGFLQGNNDRNWKVDFDFLLKPEKFNRILEGGYGNGAKPKETSSLYD